MKSNKVDNKDSEDISIIICLLLMIVSWIINVLTKIPILFIFTFLFLLFLWREIYYYLDKSRVIILLSFIVFGSLLLNSLIGVHFAILLVFIVFMLFLWIVIIILYAFLVDFP